jgi:hypothetical protein
MRKLRSDAEIFYANSYDKEYAIDNFMDGAEHTIKLLQLTNSNRIDNKNLKY